MIFERLVLFPLCASHSLYQDEILSLTWRSPRGFRFDLKTLKMRSEFKTPYKDGWGLAFDGKHFIVTDSGTQLFFLDPETMQEVRRVTVHDDDRDIEMVNELEYINGELYANIFQKECIARIDPESGKVKGWIVMDDILDRVGKAQVVPNRLNDNVLNGIAFNTKPKNLLVSGKRWPSMFEISLREHKLDGHWDLAHVRQKCIPAMNVFRRH